MNEFDELMEAMQRYFNLAVEKTGDAANISIKYVIKTSMKNKINGLYTQLGRAHYLTEKGLKDESKLAAQIIEEIEQVRREYTEMCEAMSESVNSLTAVACVHCGERCPRKSRYCTRCGKIM